MATWNTASDWDGATSESGVVHESVTNTDHNDASIVKKGHRIQNPYLSPVALYPLQEDSGSTAYNFGTSGPNGSVGSGVSVNNGSLLDTSTYQFSGNNSSGESVSLGDADLLSGSSATVAAWVYIDSFNAGTGSNGHFSTTHGQVIGKQGSSASNSGDNYLLGVLDDQTVGWYVDAGSGNTVTEGGSLNSSTWHFVAGTYDSSSGDMILYVDGSQANSNSASTGGLQGNNNPVGIGASPDGNYGGNYFTLNGHVTYAYFWTQTLSSNEIQTLYDVVNSTSSITTDYR